MAFIASHNTFFEFTVASGCSEFVVLILQLSAIKSIAIEEAIAMAIAHVVFIAAYEEVPVVAAEVVIDVSQVRVNIVIIAIASRTVISKADAIGADTVGYFRAVVNLSIGTDTNTIIPTAVPLSFSTEATLPKSLALTLSPSL